MDSIILTFVLLFLVALALFAGTRVFTVPEIVPTRLREKAIELPTLMSRIQKLAHSFNERSKIYESATSLQKERMRNPNDEMADLVKRHMVGSLILVEGRIVNISASESSIKVKIKPTTYREFFRDDIEVNYSLRWKGALATIACGAQVEVVGVLKDLSVYGNGGITGKLLLRQSNGDYTLTTNNAINMYTMCRMKGKSITFAS